jgi:NodT family efflux transporter outer membrane factor (OMF) lipoprotein
MRKQSHRFTVVAASLAAAWSAGCKVGPDYVPPTAALPAHFAATRPATQPAEDLTRWWLGFGDPLLAELIEEAQRTGLDVARAEARLRQARASRAASAGGLWPALDASASYRRSRSPGAGDAPARTSSLYQAGLDAAWEIDLFGGTRRAVEAADAQLLAAREDVRGVLVSLAAEMALNYVDLRTVQTQIRIARDNLELQTRSADIARRRFAAGATSRLDLANAEAQLATTRAQIPALEQRAREDMHAMSVLLGREPAHLIALLEAAAGIPPAPPEVPSGLPSELLRRRPDLRAAEARLHAATARIGAATADLYPRFTLTGSLGLSSDRLRGLSNLDNHSWGLGPAVSWNIFDGGRTRANIALQTAVLDESLLAYQAAVLTALREVEDALVARARQQERREALTEAVDASRRALDLAQQLYSRGQVEFIEVLSAQRSLYVAEESLAQATASVSTSVVSLYKALGGGWDPAAASTQPAR